MIRRVFWTGLGVGLGATAGILLSRRLRRTGEALAPASLAGAAAGAFGGLTERFRAFADEVRIGMAEREEELVEALGLTGDPYPDGMDG